MKRDSEIIEGIFLEGIFKFVLPTVVLFTGGTYLLRKRAATLKSTPVERGILTFMHYYAGAAGGASVGMSLYEPIMRRKILEQAPNSDVAQRIREDARSRGH